MRLDDWTISKELYHWILGNIAQGSTIFEFGSGVGTQVLSMHYKMVSVEHNRKYLNKHASRYIYAPIKNNWYDLDWTKLPKEYACVLIDGPTGDIGRFGIVKHLHKLNKNSVFIVDDTHRREEQILSREVQKWKGTSPIVIDSKNKQAHVYI